MFLYSISRSCIHSFVRPNILNDSFASDLHNGRVLYHFGLHFPAQLADHIFSGYGFYIFESFAFRPCRLLCGFQQNEKVRLSRRHIFFVRPPARSFGSTFLHAKFQFLLMIFARLWPFVSIVFLGSSFLVVCSLSPRFRVLLRFRADRFVHPDSDRIHMAHCRSSRTASVSTFLGPFFSFESPLRTRPPPFLSLTHSHTSSFFTSLCIRSSFSLLLSLSLSFPFWSLAGTVSFSTLGSLPFPTQTLLPPSSHQPLTPTLYGFDLWASFDQLIDPIWMAFSSFVCPFLAFDLPICSNICLPTENGGRKRFRRLFGIRCIGSLPRSCRLSCVCVCVCAGLPLPNPFANRFHSPLTWFIYYFAF